MLMYTPKNHPRAHGFTIVELLIVVVVIAILAAITIVSYNGISTRAHQTKLVSNISSIGTLMGVDQATGSSYPLTPEAVNGGKGIQDDADIAYLFHSTGTTFCITANSTRAGVDSYYVSSDSLSPTKGKCPQDVGATVGTLAGSGTSGYLNGVGAGANLASPAGIVVSSGGLIYFTDGATSRIRSVTTSGATPGKVELVSGTWGPGYNEGASGVSLFSWPQGVTMGPGGVLYIVDSNNNRVRQVTAAGVASFIAGNTAGNVEGAGTTARFNVPRGIVYSPTANRIYIADSQNNRIREVTTDGTGTVTPFAGQTSGGWVEGNGIAAKFNNPQGMAVDGSGNLYVADTKNHRIRKITPAGVVSTVAGNSTAGWIDANGASARFNNPMGVAVDTNGILYVADTDNHRIRKIATNGDVTTIAGDGTTGWAEGAAASARFAGPVGIAVSTDGRLYVADTANHRIRVITNY